jgi:hypothetical protein
MSHTCHARGCTRTVKPELLMRLQHWRLVPRDIQRAVWENYRPGQCDDKRPSSEWFNAAEAAIGYVALREKQPPTNGEAKDLAAAGYKEFIVKRFGEDKRAVVEALLDGKQVPR